MHPTIDEQLRGVLRLLVTIDGLDEMPDEAREILANIRRLVSHSQRASIAAGAFYDEDNHELANLLTRLNPEWEPGAPEVPVTDRARRNADLRELLTCTIQNFPDNPAGAERRNEIGRYLLRRVERDPV